MIATLLTVEQLTHLLNSEQPSLLIRAVWREAAKPTPEHDSETLLLVSTPFEFCLADMHTAFCISLDHMLLYL